MGWNSGIIMVHFPENGMHGCGKHCPFCIFEQTNYNIPIMPSDDEVLDFLKYVEPWHKVQICGAGDPLFNFEKNGDYIVHLVNIIRKQGFHVELVTKYQEVVDQYIDSKLSGVGTFVFSIETIDEELRRIVDKVTKLGHKVRVSKIANFTKDIHDIDWEFMRKYAEFYSNIEAKDNLSLCFRPNFNYNYDDDDVNIERAKFEQLEEVYGCHIYMHAQSKHISTIQLWLGRFVPCGQTRKFVMIDLGLKPEDIPND